MGYQCRIGSPGLVGELTLAVLTFVGNYVFMSHMGDDGVGAFGIACYYTPFIFMVGNATAQSAQPIISYNFGLGLWQRVRQTLRVAIMTAVGCGLLVTVVFILFPRLLTGLFISLDTEAARLSVAGLPLFAVAFVFYVVNLTCIGYFQSVERVKPAMALRAPAGCHIPCAGIPRAAGHHGRRRHMACTGSIGGPDHRLDSRIHGHQAVAQGHLALTMLKKAQPGIEVRPVPAIFVIQI